MYEISEFADGSDPHPVDRHVGQRLRLRRTQAGLSQERLGAAIGKTAQQVQKYERGMTRVSASVLWEVASVLGTDVGYFFEGLPAGARRDAVADSAAPPTEEGQEILRLLPRIPAEARRKLLDLLRSLAERDDVIARVKAARR